MIQIPENLIKICRDNTVNALAMFSNIKEPSTISFDEYQNFYQAKVFLEKFKMDGWLMCRQIWEAVWEDLAKELNIENSKISYLTIPKDCFDLVNDKDDYSLFVVSYEINKDFELNLSIVLYWQNKQLGILSSINNQDGDNFPIMQETSKLTAVKNSEYGSYNVSQHTVLLSNYNTISDGDIEQFRKSAQEIISYFNQHQQEVLSNLK